MCLTCLEMDGRSKRPLPWTTIASHKLLASEYDTIYCKYSCSNYKIIFIDSGFFSVTWQTKFTTSESKILRFPSYRQICLRVLANVPVTRLTRYIHRYVTGTRFRCTKSVSVTSTYCIQILFSALQGMLGNSLSEVHPQCCRP